MVVSLEQINFENIHFKVVILQKNAIFGRIYAACGALHSPAALEHLHFFKVEML